MKCEKEDLMALERDGFIDTKDEALQNYLKMNEAILSKNISKLFILFFKPA